MPGTRFRTAVQRIRLGLTRRGRRKAVAVMAQAGQAPMPVLFYHRVADTHANPWTLPCSSFRQHVDYCQRYFELISLAEVQSRCAQQNSHRPAVSFTFDDGYAENCDFAIPLLIQRRIPCTYFVTLDHLRHGVPFAHDVQRGQPLPVNTIAQIREMAEAGIEIGLHARTHIDFSTVSDSATLRREITDASRQLADLLGRPIRYFAFPYGMPAQLTRQAIETIYHAGMAGFCSAYGAYNLVGQDAFHIRRIHGDLAFTRLENWLTFDSRKLVNQPVIDYTLPSTPPQGPSLAGPYATPS